MKLKSWLRLTFKTFSRSLGAYTKEGRGTKEKKMDWKRWAALFLFDSLCGMLLHPPSLPSSTSTTPNPPFFLFLCRLSWEVWCLFKRRRLHVFLCLLIKKWLPFKGFSHQWLAFSLSQDDRRHWEWQQRAWEKEILKERKKRREKKKQKERKGKKTMVRFWFSSNGTELKENVEIGVALQHYGLGPKAWKHRWSQHNKSLCTVI